MKKYKTDEYCYILSLSRKNVREINTVIFLVITKL